MPILKIILTTLTSLTLLVSGLFTPKPPVAQSTIPVETRVLGVATQSAALQFNVNVPAVFGDMVTFNKTVSAPNIVTSVQGKTGNVTFSAGSGVTLDGLKITNSDLGSAQNIFKTITVGSTSFSAGSNTDTLTFAASGGTSVSIDKTNKKVTFSSTAPDYTQGGWTVSGTSVYPTTITNNIGIGTTSPTTPLYVSGASTLAGAVTIGGALTDAITFTGRLANGTSILPNTDLGSDLGASGKRFNNLWVANINSNSSQSFSGQTTFSYAPTDTTISQASVLINPTISAANGQLLGLGIAGYQRALVDAEGDIILGYNGAISAPASSYPLKIYGHNATNVSYVDTSGNGYFAGNVGIGTTSPGYSLDVNRTTLGGLTTINITNSDNNNSSGTALNLNTWSGISTIANVKNNAYGGRGELQFFVNNAINPRLVIDNNGLVGIGTTAPLSLLDVEGGNGGNAAMIVNNPLSGDLFTASASGIPKFVIANNGNVGIGTTSPTSLLHVNGAVTGKALMNLNETGDQALLTASASGVTKFIIDHSGNVGIGTNSPTNAITINKTGYDGILINLPDSFYKMIAFGSGLSSSTPGLIATSSFMELNSAGTLYLNWSTGSDINFNHGKMYLVSSTGNVGIGTATPITKLEVKTSSNTDGITLTEGSYGGQFFGTNSFGTNGGLIIKGTASNAGGGNSGITILSDANKAIVLAPGRNSVGTLLPSQVSTTYLVAADSSTDILRWTNSSSNILGVINNSGNVGIGTTSPTSLLHVNGAVTGKALMNLNETGDQALLTASASGIPKLTVFHNGLVNGTAGGLATYTKAGTISDTDFTDTAVNGLMGFDSTNGRLYIRNGGVWSYIAKTAGFQIPKEEADGLSDGDFLIPYVEKHLSDGGLHGLYTSFNSAKGLLFAAEDGQIASLSTQLASMQHSAVTYATTADLSTTNALVATLQSTVNGIVNSIASLTSTVTSLVTRMTNLENKIQSGTVTIPSGKKGLTMMFANAFTTSPLVVISGVSLPHYQVSATETAFTLTFDTTVGSDTTVTWVAMVPTAGGKGVSFDTAPQPTPSTGPNPSSTSAPASLSATPVLGTSSSPSPIPSPTP